MGEWSDWCDMREGAARQSQLENRMNRQGKPIYNDPNHPQYGICRRIHLILMYLYGENLQHLEETYFMRSDDTSWTETVVQYVTTDNKECDIARNILNEFSLEAGYGYL